MRCDWQSGYRGAVTSSSPFAPARPTVRVAAALLAWIATACDTVGPGADEPTIGRKDLADAELDARCEYLVRCGFYPDDATCKDVERPDPQLVQAVGTSVFDRVEIDGEAAHVWIETLRNLSCIATHEVAQELQDARLPVFAGNVKNGGACFSDYECVEDNVCDRSLCPQQQLCCTGSCVVFTILAERDPCPLPSGDGARILAQCDPITYCQAPEVEEGAEPPTVGTCTLRVENGLPCTSNAGCVDGQRCDVQDSGACFKLSPHDGPCNAMLATNPCLEINDTCDPASTTCTVAPGPGEACPRGQCAGWATCRDDDGDPMTPEVCIAFARRFEACDMIPCLGDLVCREGFCADITTEYVCLEGDPPPPPETMDGG